MRLLVSLALGAIVAACTWRAMADTFAQPLFARRNHRGVEVPVGAGLVLAISAVIVEGMLTVADAIDGTVAPADRAGRLFVLVVVLGFCLLGLVDDLAAAGPQRGFRGHVGALSRGHLTTGGLKLAVGGLLALVAASSTGERGLGRLVLSALVIALGANLGNLLDRAPGRTIKVALVAAIPLFAAASAADRSELTGVAVVVGAALGLLGYDLRERLMLGDAGSNVLGAALGVGLVLTTEVPARLVALVVLLVLNVLSERVSFSRIIEANAPLRALDRLGRRNVDPAP
ncbi:MAG: UDP-N-acetylmuramyl pentapeptide phosphotransferase/UDP-N-acetylglucosamine-phosphate transferase [Acidimicrobiales bacterium]|nr:UDP-N-acetylmuramyl pentapeptide phosphotransferase/UDP-N-acetylglucosamine-phosphate transferase [Acidimicrobiales bacterium]